VIADLAAGPATYLIGAIASRPGVRAVLGDIDRAALQQASAGAKAAGVADRVITSQGSAFDRDRLAALDPRPDIVLELGLYGMFSDDDLIARHFRDLAELVAPSQIVANVQCDNPEIEHIARVWPSRSGGRCVWRLRPVEQILGYAEAAGYRAASITADRHGIYRVMRLVREPR
jgi:Putative methyltransferase